MPLSDSDKVAKVFLLLLAIAISWIFYSMVDGFLIAVFFAAVFSALASPLYHRLLKPMRQRRSLAAGATVLAVFLVIILPLLGLVGIVSG